MNLLIYNFENDANYVDAATIRKLTAMPKVSLWRKLNALEATKEYATVRYGTRILYHASILNAFGITMSSQKDATTKNESDEQC